MGAPRARRSARSGATLTVSTIPTKLARQQIAALRGKTKASPRGMGVHRWMLYRRSAHSRGGVPSSVNWWKRATAVGTVTASARLSPAASDRLST
jgi:hypothetical protein